MKDKCSQQTLTSVFCLGLNYRVKEIPKQLGIFV